MNKDLELVIISCRTAMIDFALQGRYMPGEENNGEEKGIVNGW